MAAAYIFILGSKYLTCYIPANWKCVPPLHQLTTPLQWASFYPSNS